jgi:quercetin dioxygenase-like cupin family protein
MVTRRILFQTVLKSGLGTLCAQLLPFAEATAAEVHPIFEQSLPAIALNNWTVTALEVDYPPGGASEPHRHPGFVLAYVLEGKLRSQLKGQPEHTYASGEMFFEPPDSVHLISANASTDRPAKLLALIFAEKGSTLSLPA